MEKPHYETMLMITPIKFNGRKQGALGIFYPITIWLDRYVDHPLDDQTGHLIDQIVAAGYETGLPANIELGDPSEAIDPSIET